jgi:hypothetical protein
MSIPRKSPLEIGLNIVVIIAFSINVYYLFATDNPPKWVKFGNAFGWIILMYLLLKPRFKQK